MINRSPTPVEPMRDDVALVTRLITAHRRRFSESDYRGGMWKEIFNRYHRQMNDVFMTASVEACAELLRDPASNYLMYGYENLFKGVVEPDHNDVSHLRK